ncbi:MAG: hypothetical protein M1833_001745 [Piccolia ochrophora]|nr:MAG: hypothetical protein M1833_001745 [Piccolia ochrophora]
MPPIPAPFLRIPLEIRLDIYEIVFDKRQSHLPKYYLCALLVCHQIRDEAFPVLLKNDRYFRNVENLFQWISEGDPNHLTLVKKIDLRVSEDSWPTIAKFVRAPPPPKDPLETYEKNGLNSDPETGDLYKEQSVQHAKNLDKSGMSSALVQARLRVGQAEEARGVEDEESEVLSLASTWATLKSLKGLQTVWITFRTRHSTQGVDYGLEKEFVVNVMADTWHELRSLSFLGYQGPLSFLRNFHELQQLRFSGYSTSSPEETLDILRSLSRLESLIICRYPVIYDADHGIKTSEFGNYLSLTAGVIEKLRPLKLFQIMHMSDIVPSQHFTAPVMRALKTHRASLRTLRLQSDITIGIETLAELLALISSSQLEDLSLSLAIPGSVNELNVKKYLPTSIRKSNITIR